AYSDKATALAEAKDPEGAAVMARQAVRFDPLLADPLEILGDPTSLERAVQLDPYHSGHRFRLAVSLQLRADYHGALREAEAALKAQPMVSAYYTKVAELQGLLLIQALHEGDLPAARQMGKNLLALGQAFTARKAVADPLQHLWNSPKLRMDDLFKLRYGQGLFLAGDRASAEPLLKEAAKSGLLGSEAHVWLYAIYEQRGDTKAMAELATKPWIRFRQQNPVFKAISSWK
ncbi:MAG TPA: hypothetical protein VD902_19285, partial [Symbiobacteriaceae bacterium]|nr:hypothetical protein [Symbiobacteriaceae bacterium]